MNRLQIVLVVWSAFATFTLGKSIETQLKSEWAETWLLAESLEFFAESDVAFFWRVVEGNDAFGDLPTTQEGQVNTILTAVAAHGISASRLALLKFALSTRHYSPRVQAHYSLAEVDVKDTTQTAVSPPGDSSDCFAITYGKEKLLWSNGNGLAEYLESEACAHSRQWASGIVDIGTRFPRQPSVSERCTVALYCEVGSPRLLEFHSLLVASSAKYIFRHHLSAFTRSKHLAPVVLQSYGVELAAKNLEYRNIDESAFSAADTYEVDTDDSLWEEDLTPSELGIDFQVLSARYPQHHSAIKALRSSLSQQKLQSLAAGSQEVKVWELQNLGFQASVKVLRASSPLSTLKDLSQNFPKRVNMLSRLPITGDAFTDIQTAIKNRQHSYPVNEAGSELWINGRPHSIEELTTFKVFDAVQSEYELSTLLNAPLAHLTGEYAGHVVNELYFLPHEKFDNPNAPYLRKSVPRARFQYVLWMNDMENDAFYNDWGSDVMTITRRHYGQQYYPKRNLLNTVTVFDPADSFGLLDQIQHTRNNGFPFRNGVVIVSSDLLQAVSGQLKEVSYKLPRQTVEELTGYAPEEVSDTITIDNVSVNIVRAVCAASNYFTDSRKGWDMLVSIGGQRNSLSNIKIKETFLRSDAWASPDQAREMYDTFMTGRACDKLILNNTRHLAQQGITTLPASSVNGNVREGKSLRETINELWNNELTIVRDFAYRGVLRDTDASHLDIILSTLTVSERFNAAIQKGARSFVVLSEAAGAARGALAPLTVRPSRQQAQTEFVTVEQYLVFDPSTAAGVRTAIFALSGLDSLGPCNNNDVACTRLTLLPYPYHAVLSKFIVALLKTASGPGRIDSIIEVLNLLQITLKVNNDDSDSRNIEASLEGIMWKLREMSGDGGSDTCVLPFLLDHSAFTAALAEGDRALQEAIVEVGADLKRDSSTRAVILVAGRLFNVESWLSADFKLAVNHEFVERIRELYSALNKYLPLQSKAGLEGEGAFSNVATFLAKDVIKNGRRQRYAPQIQYEKTDFSFSLIPADSVSRPHLGVVSVLNPLSKEAQKVSSFLELLHTAFDAHVTVFLNPQHKISELPLKSYYRYVVAKGLTFTVEGQLEQPVAVFRAIPANGAVYTMAIEEPQAWITVSHVAPVDLDNIKIEEIPKLLRVEYVLQYLLLTGSCNSEMPPRGLQLELLKNGLQGQERVDTLVMSNFGYFQLKANPGVWALQLPPKSRSHKLYEVQGTHTADGEAVLVAITSYDGKHITLRVNKRKGHEHEQLLSGDAEDSTDSSDSTTLNIFTVASGHLYERLLKVMIHTTMNYTRKGSNVKFWFINNFLSPQFRKFIPHMSKEWGFNYELVTYKWPTWLNKQTEKQRIIWGYKILFLDVLFPLNLRRVIFVDADQIIRTDLHELYNIDMQGNPLAYTPFCDSNKATEGFRFWKQGFWVDHLQGKPYHISALYVVDLWRLRLQAAGDQLRMVYDNLSQDRNSLANLDQDLPNYTQHNVGIFSLPSEWLWCEAWCDNDSKPSAKTIDLCNNPQTKTPKLENARRIIPEWDSYDKFISEFAARIV